MNNIEISATLLEELRERHLTLSSAESCTGGNIAHCLTAVPGASDVFNGAVVAYSNDIKQRLLNVSPTTLEQFGAVSTQTVREMLTGAVQTLGTDCAVATSGIAGPGGGTPTKPVGTVCIGAKLHGHHMVDTFHFQGSRTEVIEQSTRQALIMLADLLAKHTPNP